MASSEWEAEFEAHRFDDEAHQREESGEGPVDLVAVAAYELYEAAGEAVHMSLGQQLTDGFLRTLGNTVLQYGEHQGALPWAKSMERLQLALLMYAARTHDSALARMATGLGVTHAFAAEHNHLGRRYPCGLYEAREQFSSRRAAIVVSTRPGDRITCAGCLAATGGL